MAKKRVTRKQLLKEPDEFITTTGKLIRWSRTNQTPLLVGVCTVLVILGGFSIYSYFTERSEKTASAELAVVTERALRIESQESSSEAVKQTSNAFEAIIDGYPSKAVGRMATLAFANLCYRAGEVDRALSLYSRLASGGWLSDFAIAGKAYCYVKKKDLAQAAQFFEKAVASGNSALAEDARFNLGVIYGELGQADKSRAMYEKILADDPDSIFVEIAKEKAAG